MGRVFRILLVEDFEPFRRFVRSVLQPRAEFEIVGEAVDGLDAVHKAKELQPDLVLLDIGLPKLNGIAAAEQIQILVPGAKLLFVSLESSAEVAREALRVGGHGYIHKLRAQDLEPAIDAVLAGKQFVSVDIEIDKVVNADVSHEIQFYSDDAVFLESATRFISSALSDNGGVIAIATKSHATSLVQTLKADGIDVEAAIGRGTYVVLDADAAISDIMVNGQPDVARFYDTLSSLIESCAKATRVQHPRVALFGEGVGLLCAEGQTAAAVKIEHMANELRDSHRIKILCACPLSAFPEGEHDRGFQDMCAAHTAVFSR